MGLLAVGGFTSDSFSYTGTYKFTDEGSGKWYLDFLTSGTLTLKKAVKVDIHAVGGGGGGGSTSLAKYGAGGGAGGKTKTVFAQQLSPTTYKITIGAGGAVKRVFAVDKG